MKVGEIIKLGKEMLEMLQKAGIKVSYVNYLCMYEEYRKHMEKNEKKSYVVMLLSDKYNISERKVYYLIKLFEKDCKIGAVE